MDKKPNWLQRRLIEFRMGVKPAQWVNLGQIDTSTVIRFKDYYVNVMERDGEIVNLGWSKNSDMFPDLNLNNVWVAVAPTKESK